MQFTAWMCTAFPPYTAHFVTLVIKCVNLLKQLLATVQNNLKTLFLNVMRVTDQKLYALVITADILKQHFRVNCRVHA